MVEAARLAALRINQAHRRRIGQALSVLEDTMRSGVDALEADFQFHLEIARATENDLFEKQLMFLRPDMMGTMRIASTITVKRSDDRRERVLQEHRDIFQAISAGDAELAKLYMQYHLISVRNRIIDDAN